MSSCDVLGLLPGHRRSDRPCAIVRGFGVLSRGSSVLMQDFRYTCSLILLASIATKEKKKLKSVRVKKEQCSYSPPSSRRFGPIASEWVATERDRSRIRLAIGG